MPSPYRETDNIPPAPLAELRWRRSVMRRARWATLLALGGIPALVVSHWLLVHYVRVGVVVWSIAGVALAVATWMLTARRPGGHVGFSGWLVRGSTLVSVALAGVLLESAGYVRGALAGVPLKIPSDLAGTLPLGVGLLLATPATILVATRFRNWRDDLEHGETGALIRYLTAAVFFGMLCEQLPPTLRSGGFFLLLTAFCFYGLGRKMLPAEQQWWFDNQAGTPGEWAALVVYPRGTAEVLRNGDRPGWFQTRHDAMGWLSQEGYLPADRAIAERLVDRIPPDVLPLMEPREPSRWRKNKQRVRGDEPRVRVAAEADAVDEEGNEIEEQPLDEAERPRAARVRTPDR